MKPWAKREAEPNRKRGRAGVADRNRIKIRDGYACQQPGCPYIGPDLEIDHIVPFSKGGTDADSNKRALCIPCHLAKSEKERGGTSRRVGCDENGIPFTRSAP